MTTYRVTFRHEPDWEEDSLIASFKRVTIEVKAETEEKAIEAARDLLKTGVTPEWESVGVYRK